MLVWRSDAIIQILPDSSFLLPGLATERNAEHAQILPIQARRQLMRTCGIGNFDELFFQNHCVARGRRLVVVLYLFYVAKRRLLNLAWNVAGVSPGEL
jgi:hypothetical protein